jgi:transposase
VNKIRSSGLLIDKKQKHKRRILTGEKLENIRARLQHTPTKSLKRVAQDNEVSHSSARTATKLAKLRPYKTTVIH